MAAPREHDLAVSQKTYEVWMEQADGQWNRIMENTPGGPEELFEELPLAKAAAMKVALRPDAVRSVIIERRPCAEFNGPSKRLPHPIVKPTPAATALHPIKVSDPKADVPAGT